jgi:hypothetical protein
MRWLLTPVLAMSLLIGPRVAAQTPEPEIWFNPHGAPVDILDMWTDTALWQQAAQRVNVLVLVHWWIRKQTDATLMQIFNFAKKHHMKIDLSTEPIAKIPPVTCGNEESYMGVGEMRDTITILLRLGITPDWIDMDGPVMSGHYDTSVNGCQYSIPDLVTKVAATMHLVLEAWPHIKIMDVEPLTGLGPIPTWREDVTAFHRGLEQRLGGAKVRAMQADVQWQNPRWKQDMVTMHDYVRQQNMAFSIIYDGNGTSKTDVDWINSAVANWEAVEGELHITPDQVLFTSWDAYPSHNMPESSPIAQTWLINRYPRPRTALQVQFVGLGARGKLTTTDGKPIPNAVVKGYKPGVDFSQPLPVTVVKGVVPANAVQALIGVRVNTECSCSGVNDILFGTIAYQETQGGTASGSFTFPTTSRILNGAAVSSERIGGTQVSRIISFPGQGLPLNGPGWFRVTPNAQYQFSVPAATVGGQGWFGNVIIIFGLSDGNQTRVTVVPDAGKAVMATAVTQADGTFALPHLPRSADGPKPVTVEFDGGNGSYRPTVWKPLR